jgi:heme exporter protein CcmD
MYASVDYWPFIAAAYGVTCAALCALLAVSLVAYRNGKRRLARAERDARP